MLLDRFNTVRKSRDDISYGISPDIPFDERSGDSSWFKWPNRDGISHVKEL
jgi:hypothetical protein